MGTAAIASEFAAHSCCEIWLHLETSNLQIAKPMACHPTHPTTWQSIRHTSTTRPATLLSLPPPGHHQHHTARQLINKAVKGNTKSSVNWMPGLCRHMKRQ